MFRIIIAAAALAASSFTATAQERADGYGNDPEPLVKVDVVPDGRNPAERVTLVANGLPNILVTGYWPPTNEMLRAFSPSPDQNPDVWVGEDWEGRGYNIYAFFPEFPGGTGQNPKGDGDFEVDYQDTSNDFWPLVDELRPIAVLSFGRAGWDFDWELEGGNQMYALSLWSNDYLAPYDPTPELPIADESVGTQRMSTLPLQAIIDAVEAADPGLVPYSTTLDTSRFLCNYMGYHANWYRVLYDEMTDPGWCASAGFIHLGNRMTTLMAVAGTEATLRALTGHLDAIRPLFGDVDLNAVVDGADFAAFAACYSAPEVVVESGCGLSDLDRDLDADMHDVAWLQRAMP
jgi:hypothetical protein